MKPIQALVSAVLLASLLLVSGCNGIPFLQPAPSQASQTPVGTSAPALETATPGPTGTAPAAGNPSALTLWVPPQFDPNSGTPAGSLLKQRLDEFSQQHDNVKLDVRVKAVSGPANLLDSLTATSAAASQALPDLVALSRSDLESAALKGLLVPFDGLTKLPNDNDWYNYARQLALVQGSTFGLPFAGDALVMVYRPSGVTDLGADWAGITRQHSPLAFPAADSQALLTLALYQAEGGPIEDSQRRPTLSADALAQVLDLYLNGTREGTFPSWIVQVETDAQAWQAFHDQRAQMMVTWMSRYLSELPVDAAAQPLPVTGAAPFTLSTGWAWAMANTSADRRTLSVELAEWLVQSDFLAKWTAAAGYLPPRPTALSGWTDQSLQSLVSQVVLTAQDLPSNDTLAALGPDLRDATLEVLKGESDPATAAQTAAEQLKGPQ